MRRVFGKHLIRGPDQDVRVLGLEHEIRIELFHDVIRARDGRAAFVARPDPDRVKERQLLDAIFREERSDLFAVWDCSETSSKSDFASFTGSRPLGWISVAPHRHASAWRVAFAALAAPQSDPGLIRSG